MDGLLQLRVRNDGPLMLLGMFGPAGQMKALDPETPGLGAFVDLPLRGTVPEALFSKIPDEPEKNGVDSAGGHRRNPLQYKG